MANPKLIGVLVLAVGYAAWVMISNPYQTYSTEEYWTNATLQHVIDVPDKALTERNNSGPVLMFAAAATDNPKIIAALIARGAKVNEGDFRTYKQKNGFSKTYSTKVDENIKGTPLSAAASSSKTPAVIAELVKHGARLDTRLANGWTPIMVAAYWNTDARITQELVKHGADLSLKNNKNETALDIAIRQNNTGVVEVLQKRVAELAPE